jgi:hypothetical protein
MSFATGRWVLRFLVLAALLLVLTAKPAFAQRGGCMRQQSRQSGFQSQLSTQQAYATQASPYAAQAQLYAMQQYALQQYALQAQLNAQPQNLLVAQQNVLAAANLLQSQLDELHDYIAEQQEEGLLTSSQLRALRRQEKTLSSQLRLAKKGVSANQRYMAQLSGSSNGD